MLKPLLVIVVATATALSLNTASLGQFEKRNRDDDQIFEEIKSDKRNMTRILTKSDANMTRDRSRRALMENQDLMDYDYSFEDVINDKYSRDDPDVILDPKTVCGGDKDICVQLEAVLEDKARKIISTNLNMTKMHVEFLRHEKIIVEKCKAILAVQNISLSVSLVRENGRGKNVSYWLSPMHSEHFYEQCLKNYDIYRLHRKSTYVVKKLNQFSLDLGQALKNKGQVQVGGGSAQLIGGIMGGLGIVLAPISGGASLTLSIAGSSIATVGSITGYIQSKLTESFSADIIQNSEDQVAQNSEEMDFVQKLLGIYTLNQWQRIKYLDSNDYINIQDTFHQLFMEQTRGGIMSTANFVTFATDARISYVSYMKKYPASLAARSVTKIIGLTEIIRNKFVSVGAVEAFKNMKTWQISAAVKMKIRNAAKGILSLLNIGFGALDILKGTQSIEGVGDLEDTLRTAAKTYSYDAESTFQAYKNIVGDPNIMGYKESYQEVIRIGVQSANGQILAGTKLYLKSTNPHNKSEVNFCYTKILDTNSWQKLMTGYWYFVDDAELGDCRWFKVYNGTAEVRMINDRDDAVAFSNITLSTETLIVPSYACSKDGTYSSLRNAKISSYGGTLSQPLTCFPIMGISMIKTHTRGTTWSGTDGSVRMRITQCNKNVQGTCGDHGGALEDGVCTTGWLDNPGNDREENQVDTYHIDQLNDCMKPFHENFSPEHGFLQTTMNFQRWGYIPDEWNIDLLKFYVTTSILQDKPFRCTVDNKGAGTKVSDGFTNTTCKLHAPNTRGIEKIFLHVTNSYYAASTGRLQLNICNNNEESLCCTTNVIYGTFVQNQEFIVEEDYHLGECEGFVVEGSAVIIRVKKIDGNSVSFDKIEFFGASDLLLTTSEYTPFIRCNGQQIWAELGSVYIYKNGKSTSWRHWRKAPWACSYNSQTSIKNVHVKLCSDDSAGSGSAIKTVFTNIDKENCTTESLQFSNGTNLGNGDYHIFRDIGNCYNLTVIDDRVDMELMNMDQKDNLCLTHIWIDVSNSNGDVRQLQCKFHANQKELNIINRNGTRLPMKCQ